MALSPIEHRGNETFVLFVLPAVLETQALGQVERNSQTRVNMLTSNEIRTCAMFVSSEVSAGSVTTVYREYPKFTGRIAALGVVEPEQAPLLKNIAPTGWRKKCFGRYKSAGPQRWQAISNSKRLVKYFLRCD
jgi:hypothetical protein